MKNILHKSTVGNNIFNDSNFRYQRGDVENCRRWSRNLVAERRSPATISAAPIHSERKTNPTGLSDITTPLPKLDLVEAAKEKKTETKIDKGLKTETKEAGHLEAQDNLHAHWQKKPQNEKLDSFDDPTVHCLQPLPTEAMVEAAGAKQKDKSVHRRFLNWLDEIIHNHYQRKIAETYRREREEGNQFYPSKII